MLHLFPESAPELKRLAYPEAVSRLASIRHALRLVEPFGAGPAPDLTNDEAIANCWDSADEASRRLFDRRSARLVEATAAGLEALLIERNHGTEPNQAASQALADQIRRELADVAKIIVD